LPPPAHDRAGLQIDADLAYQERTWRVQRIAWGIFVVLIIGGLSGLLGSGPLSHSSAGSPGDGFTVDYDRLARAHASTTLVMHIDRRLSRNDEVGIVLSGDAVRTIEFESTTPPADGTSLNPAGAVLRFRTDRQPGELTVILYAKPRQMGALTSRIGVQGGPVHEIRQWIYP
jgi:hypothetical protein